MIETPRLIEALAANATPVKRLRHPAIRAVCWLSFAALVAILLGISHGLRPDLVQQLTRPTFVIGVGAALLTGILATLASFLVGLPDRSALWGLLPVPTLVLWLSTVGYGCLANWVGIGPDGVQPGELVQCVATLLLTSIPLSVALLVMLRHAAPINPRLVGTIGSLAVAAITVSVLSLFHELDAAVMVLMWNFGTAALIVGASGVLARRAFRWAQFRRTS